MGNVELLQPNEISVNCQILHVMLDMHCGQLTNYIYKNRTALSKRGAPSFPKRCEATEERTNHSNFGPPLKDVFKNRP